MSQPCIQLTWLRQPGMPTPALLEAKLWPLEVGPLELAGIALLKLALKYTCGMMKHITHIT